MNEKIKVFEAFAGIGTQRMALRNLGVEHEVVERAVEEVGRLGCLCCALHGKHGA